MLLEKRAYFDKLPKEILLEIFKYLDISSIYRANKVSKLWHSILMNNKINAITYKLHNLKKSKIEKPLKKEMIAFVKDIILMHLFDSPQIQKEFNSKLEAIVNLKSILSNPEKINREYLETLIDEQKKVLLEIFGNDNILERRGFTKLYKLLESQFLEGKTSDLVNNFLIIEGNNLTTYEDTVSQLKAITHMGSLKFLFDYLDSLKKLIDGTLKSDVSESNNLIKLASEGSRLRKVSFFYKCSNYPLWKLFLPAIICGGIFMFGFSIFLIAIDDKTVAPFLIAIGIILTLSGIIGCISCAKSSYETKGLLSKNPKTLFFKTSEQRVDIAEVTGEDLEQRNEIPKINEETHLLSPKKMEEGYKESTSYRTLSLEL